MTAVYKPPPAVTAVLAAFTAVAWWYPRWRDGLPCPPALVAGSVAVLVIGLELLRRLARSGLTFASAISFALGFALYSGGKELIAGSGWGTVLFAAGLGLVIGGLGAALIEEDRRLNG